MFSDDVKRLCKERSTMFPASALASGNTSHLPLSPHSSFTAPAPRSVQEEDDEDMEGYVQLGLY